MTPQYSLRQNVVAVLRNGTIAGTGFFIDRDGSILTCFHVVRDPSTGYLTDQPLSIRFNGVKYDAEYISRSLIPATFDIAVLRLVSRVLPDQATLLPLGKWDAESMVSREFVSFGYKLAGTFKGINTRSKVSSRTKIDLKENPGVQFLQLASEDLRLPEIGRGMSGAPVYHEETNQIVGVIVARSRHEDLAIPLALPMDEIARVWGPVRARLQQDELARQLGTLVNDYKTVGEIESKLPNFVNSLIEMSDVFPADSVLKGDKSQALIEQLRSRGFIYELFSYMKSEAKEIPGNSFDDILSEAYTPGPEIKFVNREEALSLATGSFAPHYLLFDAPAGYGKTELLWEIEQRYLLKGWICFYIETAQTLATARDLVQTLARSASLFRQLPELANLHSAGRIIAGMLKYRVGLAHAQGIVLLIDSIERLPDEERNSFFDHFLRRFIETFTVRTSDEQSKRLRIVLAGRYLTPNWKKTDWTFPLEVKSLEPFNYDTVLTAIQNSRWRDKGDLKSWAAHLMHVTGGHPRCIAETLRLKESRQSVEDHFASHHEAYRDIILPIINEVRSSIPEHLQDIFDRLSVFRRYNVRLLRSMIDTEVIRYDKGVVKLEQELTSTYLVNRRNKFIQDEIVRRLLAIRLRWTDPDLFLWLCERARNIYKSVLDDIHSEPEDIMIEAIYQELQLAYYQSNQDAEAREDLRQTFLGENGVVQQYIRVLAAKPNLDHDDIKLNLKEMLTGKSNDWEFHFAVNFFLRSDHYTDEPFETIMLYIDQFSSIGAM
jgi:Trypsin-like peptidase domain